MLRALSTRARRLAALAIVGAVLVSGCKRHREDAAPAPASATAGIVVRADSAGLLLTWIDDKGDFHVETQVGDVPLMGRDTVRVEDPNNAAAASLDHVVIVDLRQAEPDGTFPIRTMTRADFEAIAVARREKTGPTLASAAPPPPNAPAPADSKADTGHVATRGPVVIYGAEWCGACHEAQRYLKGKGIPYVEKDVEKDAGAAREMQDKLAKSGLRAGSIPVIDVRGKVFVGFNPQEIDSALGQAM